MRVLRLPSRRENLVNLRAPQQRAPLYPRQLPAKQSFGGETLRSSPENALHYHRSREPHAAPFRSVLGAPCLRVRLSEIPPYLQQRRKRRRPVRSAES